MLKRVYNRKIFSKKNNFKEILYCANDRGQPNHRVAWVLDNLMFSMKVDT